MADITKNWAASAQCRTSQILNGDTEVFSDNIDLETGGYEGALVQVQASFPASADENVIVSVYPNLTGDAAYDGQEVAIWSAEIALLDTDIVFYSFVIKDVNHFRLGFKHSATTDHDATITSADHQRWAWESA